MLLKLFILAIIVVAVNSLLFSFVLVWKKPG